MSSSCGPACATLRPAHNTKRISEVDRLHAPSSRRTSSHARSFGYGSAETRETALSEIAALAGRHLDTARIRRRVTCEGCPGHEGNATDIAHNAKTCIREHSRYRRKSNSYRKSIEADTGSCCKARDYEAREADSGL